MGDSRGQMGPLYTNFVIPLFLRTDRSITGKVSRADVADFMLKQVKGNAFLRKTPGLSY
ncbi:MAG TPA: hypothetical protein VK422_00505 [Pyrinomonadaceae bacterium]|nr:hypothetical protein [Pyrinomonadaceae bacterium]